MASIHGKGVGAIIQVELGTIDNCASNRWNQFRMFSVSIFDIDFNPEVDQTASLSSAQSSSKSPSLYKQRMSAPSWGPLPLTNGRKAIGLWTKPAPGVQLPVILVHKVVAPLVRR